MTHAWRNGRLARFISWISGGSSPPRATSTSSRLTTDPNDKRLGRGVDANPVPQSDVYLVLSDEERAQGFVRPVRRSYVHVGVRPTYSIRTLTHEESAEHGHTYVAYEEYTEKESPVRGRYWTAKQLNSGCGKVTTMGLVLAETYAANPKFYGSTYCVHCSMHLRVGEFVWEGTDEVVGS